MQRKAGAGWADLTYVVVDIEGSGQRPPDLVEIARVLVKDGEIGQAET